MIDLNKAASPKEAAEAMLKLAQQYRDDAAELASAWQDDKAGKAWEILANGLEKAAEKALKYWDSL